MPHAVGGARITSTCQPMASLVHKSSSVGECPAQCLQSRCAALNINAGFWDQGWSGTHPAQERDLEEKGLRKQHSFR